MNQISKVLFMAVLCFFIISSSRSVYTYIIKIQPRLLYTKGDVSILRGAESQLLPAKSMMFLNEGDIIQTDENAETTIEWGGVRKVFKIMSSSKLMLTKLEKDPYMNTEGVQLELFEGNMCGDRKNSPGVLSTLEIKTPAGITVIKDTKFIISAIPDYKVSETECFDELFTEIIREGKFIPKAVTAGTAIETTSEKETTQQGTSESDEYFQITGNVVVNFKAKDVTQDQEKKIPSQDFNKQGIVPSETTEKPTETQPSIAGQQEADTEYFEITGGVTISFEKSKTKDKDDILQDTVVVKTSPYVPPQIVEKPEIPTEQTAAETISENQQTADISASEKEEEQADEYFEVSNSLSIKFKPEEIEKAKPAAVMVDIVKKAEVEAEAENLIEEEIKTEEKSAAEIVQDTTPPVLLILEPSLNFSVGNINGGNAVCVNNGISIKCNIRGITEPGAILTINDRQGPIELDGSFYEETSIGLSDTTITVTATDIAGNRASTILTRVVDYKEPASIKMELSQTQLVSDKVSISNIKVKVYNLLEEMIDGAIVEFNVSPAVAGTLSANRVITKDGEASVVFTAGTSEQEDLVAEITAKANMGLVTDKKTITLIPDVAPWH